jgi:heterotetrameric sarcosine oxidase gamma subunit
VEAYEVPGRTGWAARYWSPIEGGEHLATRERVALYDLTAFTKIEVSGPGALNFLQYVAANQIDRPVGRVVYTSLLDQNGGIKCDLTITRLGPDRFLVLTGGATGMQDLAWLRRHAPADGSVFISDVTSTYCNIGLWGREARNVLQKVCQEDVSNQAFPYFTARHITIGHVPVLALRVSYVGELGWEIYALTEYGPRLWDTLWEAGQASGIIAAGFGAFDSMPISTPTIILTRPVWSGRSSSTRVISWDGKRC